MTTWIYHIYTFLHVCRRNACGCTISIDFYNHIYTFLYSPFPRRRDSIYSQRTAHRNPEWWGDFSQLVKIEKLKFLGISRYKFELRFWLNLNSSVSRGTNPNWDFGLIWICSWLKSPYHSGYRFAFSWPFLVSSFREWAVRQKTTPLLFSLSKINPHASNKCP